MMPFRARKIRWISMRFHIFLMDLLLATMRSIFCFYAGFFIDILFLQSPAATTTHAWHGLCSTGSRAQTGHDDGTSSGTRDVCSSSSGCSLCEWRRAHGTTAVASSTATTTATTRRHGCATTIPAAGSSFTVFSTRTVATSHGSNGRSPSRRCSGSHARHAGNRSTPAAAASTRQ